MKKEFSFPVAMKVGGQVIEYDLAKELACSEDTINEDLKNQPSFFAYYAVLTEKAQSELAEAKAALELLEATLDAQFRSEETKTTETMIKNRIRLDKSYQEALEVFNTLKLNVGLLSAAKEAFYHRKDILISLASNMRAQMDASVYLKRLDGQKP